MAFGFQDILEASADGGMGPYARRLRAMQMLGGANLNNGSIAGGLAHALQQGMMGYMQGKDESQRLQAEQAVAEAFGAPPAQEKPGIVDTVKGWFGAGQPEAQAQAGPFQPRSVEQALASLRTADPNNFYLQKQINKLQMGHLSNQMAAEEQAKLMAREDALRQQQWGREDQRFASQNAREDAWRQQELGLRQSQAEQERLRWEAQMGLKERELAMQGQPGSAYDAKSIEGNHFRIATSLAAKIQSGQPLTPQETVSYQASLAALSQEKPIPLANGQVGFAPGQDISMFPRLPQGGSRNEGVAQGLYPGQVQAESAGNPNAVSSAGAVGKAQIMAATARDPGFGVPNIFQMARQMGRQVPDESDATLQALLRDPELNLAFGGAYQQAMNQRYAGDPAKALAAYNGGPGAVDQAIGRMGEAQFMRGMPGETQAYVSKLNPGASAPQPAPAPQPAQPGMRFIETPAAAAERQRTQEWRNVQKNAFRDTFQRVDKRFGSLGDGGTPQILTGLPGMAAKYIPWADTAQQQGDYDLLTEQVVSRIRDASGGRFTDDDARRAARELGVLSVSDPIDRQKEILSNYRRLMDGDDAGVLQVVQQSQQKDPLEGRQVPTPSPEAQQNFDRAKTQYNVNQADPGKVSVPQPKGPAYGADIPVMNTPEEAMALPPGTRFRTPDGRIKVR